MVAKLLGRDTYPNPLCLSQEVLPLVTNHSSWLACQLGEHRSLRASRACPFARDSRRTRSEVDFFAVFPPERYDRFDASYLEGLRFAQCSLCTASRSRYLCLHALHTYSSLHASSVPSRSALHRCLYDPTLRESLGACCNFHCRTWYQRFS